MLYVQNAEQEWWSHTCFSQ